MIKAIKKSLYLQFILVYMVFGLACLLVVALFSSRFTYREELAGQASDLYSEAAQLAQDYSQIYSGNALPEDFRDQINGLAAYTNQRIWFLSTDGTIFFDSDEDDSLEDTQLTEFDYSDYKKNYTTGTFYDVFSETMLSVITPVTANMKTYGYIVIHMPLNDVILHGDRSLIPVYLTVGIIYAFSLLLLILFRQHVLKPLKKITEGTREFSSGNWKHQIPVNSEDEFGYLAGTLNVMATDLATSEENQRRFIANVSHDFRSPLTSIRGYLQAMIDGVIPEEMQEKYMQIVINETERLTNLTQSMLSMDSLDRKNIHLEYSDFDICPVIKNVCATFEGKCTSRGISIELVFTTARIPVHADMGKIQQVIYNLVDNAIKFSHENSEIRIQVSRKRDRIYVSIKDNGIGIPKESLPKIWTRFFKTDQSRGKDKKGTGLGLSIVKEIITAHGETIDVISTEGVGTEFIFRLQAADPKNVWELLDE